MNLKPYDLTAFDYEGKTFHVKIMDDDFCEPPWEHSDGHGPVSDWTRRDKKAGEWVLCEDRGSKRYYDFAEAMRLARKDGWDAEPYGVGTKGERALCAVTVDEFPFNTKSEKDEAGRCVAEYRLSDSSANYDLSPKSCKDWRDTTVMEDHR